MDHLPIPPQFRDRGISVPRLGVAPAYDRQGFEGYPSRFGVEVTSLPLHWTEDDEIPNDETLRSRSQTESFFQEWLWFGLMHEFELACGVENHAHYTTVTDGKEVLDTTPLVGYMRRAVINEILKLKVPLDLQVGDLVVFRKIPSDKSQIKPTRIVSRDLVNLTYGVGDPSIWTGPLEYFSKIGTNATGFLDTASIRKSLASTSLNVLMVVLKKARQYYWDQNLGIQYSESTTRLSRCLLKTAGLTRKIIFRDKPVLRFEIALSISILCETIQHLIEQVWGNWIELERTGTMFFENKFRDDMISKNWCPARIETLLVWTVAIQYISSLLPSSDTISHRKCSSLSCVQKPSNPENIQPQHWKTDCDCEVVAFEEVDLIKVLEQGGNPGLLRTKGETGQHSYKIFDVTGQDFVAISHVFTQGRGNSTANALPMCQLDMLFEAIEALEVRCLWIDTISVPINPKFKRRAISKLRETYTMATKVLVVDRRLMQFGSHWMERRLQVLASEWMGRLWTLQEGRLASELYFQFKDKAVGATELVDAHPNEEHEDLASLSRCFAHTGKENRVYFEKQDSVIKKFLNLIEDLSPRSVTFASDEPICIATLLGLKLEDFHPYPTMVDIYRSMEAIPPEVLFLTAPKINLPGFRWAPTTFLELDRRWFIYPDRQSAKLTPRGLELTKDCIFLSGDIEIKKGNMYFVNQSTDDSKSTFAFQRSNNSRADSKTKTFKDAAIIIERSEDTFTGSSSGVLVSVASTDTGKRSSFIKSTRRLLKSKKKEEPIHCTFEMQLVVFPVNESTTPEIERRLAWPDSKSINLSGDFCRDVEFCVD